MVVGVWSVVWSFLGELCLFIMFYSWSENPGEDVTVPPPFERALHLVASTTRASDWAFVALELRIAVALSLFGAFLSFYSLASQNRGMMRASWRAAVFFLTQPKQRRP